MNGIRRRVSFERRACSEITRSYTMRRRIPSCGSRGLQLRNDLTPPGSKCFRDGTTCFPGKARFPGHGTRLHCDGTNCLRHEAMLVHEKATSFCCKATLLFEKPIWFCANVMLQCEKPTWLCAKAMC